MRVVPFFASPLVGEAAPARVGQNAPRDPLSGRQQVWDTKRVKERKVGGGNRTTCASDLPIIAYSANMGVILRDRPSLIPETNNENRRQVKISSRQHF